MSWFTKILGLTRKTDGDIIDEYEEQAALYEQQQEMLYTQEQEQEQEPAEPDYTSKVEFVVLPDSHIEINVSWGKASNVTAEALGHLMWHIHNGSFAQKCTEVLMKIAHEKPDSQTFVKKCMDTWRTKAEQQPLIKPSEVFKTGSEHVE